MSKHFQQIVSRTPPETKRLVSKSMDILDRLHELLHEKFEGKQNLLAQALGKSEAEVSKILNGVQNFTLKTITKLEAAFEADIIAITTNSEHCDYVAIKAAPMQSQSKTVVTVAGVLGTQTDFEAVKLKPSVHTSNPVKTLA